MADELAKVLYRAAVHESPCLPDSWDELEDMQKLCFEREARAVYDHYGIAPSAEKGAVRDAVALLREAEKGYSPERTMRTVKATLRALGAEAAE